MFGDLLCELVQIPGPSGFESRVTARLKELIQPYVDEVRIDKIGNIIARKKGSEGKRSLAIAAHTDEVIDINTGVRAASLLTQAIADSEKWED